MYMLDDIFLSYCLGEKNPRPISAKMYVYWIDPWAACAGRVRISSAERLLPCYALLAELLTSGIRVPLFPVGSLHKSLDGK